MRTQFLFCELSTDLAQLVLVFFGVERNLHLRLILAQCGVWTLNTSIQQLAISLEQVLNIFIKDPQKANSSELNWLLETGQHSEP